MLLSAEEYSSLKRRERRALGTDELSEQQLESSTTVDSSMKRSE